MVPDEKKYPYYASKYDIFFLVAPSKQQKINQIFQIKNYQILKERTSQENWRYENGLHKNTYIEHMTFNKNNNITT